MPTHKGEMFPDLLREVLTGTVVFLLFQKLYPISITELMRTEKQARGA